MTSIAITHREDILERMAAGETIKDIAASYGISQPAISKQFHDDPDFKAAKLQAVESRLDLWEERLETVNDSTSMVMFARCKEGLSHARWRAEVMAPETYSRKPTAVQVNVNMSKLLDDSLYTSAMDVVTNDQ